MAPNHLRRLGGLLWLFRGSRPNNFYSKHIQTMLITVEEIATAPNSTRSQLFVNGRPFCDVIEDGYREIKIPGETRIPAGRYEIRRRKIGKFFTEYQRRFKHEFSIEIFGVPDFSDVLIHIGNTRKDTRGCLLVVFMSGMDQYGEFVGEKSTEAYKALYTQIALAFDRKEKVEIEIIRREVVDEGTFKPVG